MRRAFNKSGYVNSVGFRPRQVALVERKDRPCDLLR
jgi:hypothetical protein